MLLFAGLIVFFGAGILLGLPAAFSVPDAEQVLFVMILAAAVLLLFVPVLVTGDGEGWAGRGRQGASLIRAWSPRRVFGDATLPSGLPLALLLTALVLGLTAAALHWGMQGGARMVMGRGYAASPRGLTAATTQWAALSAHLWDVLEQASLMLILVVIGVAGLGFLLSTLLGNRWSALTLLYLTLVLAVALPFFSYATMTGTEALAAAHNPAVSSLYLCPFVPMMQLATRLSPGSDLFHVSEGSAIPAMIGYDIWPLWIGTGMIYLAVGLISYAVALALLRRRPIKTV